MLEPSTERLFRGQLASMLAAAGNDDCATFALIAAMLREAADAGIRTACGRLREQGGYSWDEIATDLGVTRSTAREVYGPTRRVRRPK